MGYRSDIMVCMKKENFEEVKDIFKKAYEEGSLTESESKLMNYIEDYRETDAQEPIVAFSWLSVKWYPDYNDVELFEKYLDVLDERDIAYKFIRIGEDWDDVEVRENWVDGECDYIHLYRDFSCDI